MEFIFSWSTLWWLMFLLYFPACLGLVVIVLLQKGKGAGFAGAFGVGGGSDTVFGPRMAKSLPQKLTYTMAGIFMVLALVLSLVGGKASRGGAPKEAVVEAAGAASQSDIDSILNPNAVPTPEANTAPVAPAAASPETPVPAAPAVATETPVVPAEAAPEAAAPPAEQPPAAAPETPAPVSEPAPAESAPAEQPPAATPESQ